MIVPIMRSALS